jgi:CheY-like chemotaxis protein
VNGSAHQQASAGANGTNGQGYDAADKPFDFIEEEGKTAIICESSPLVRQSIIDNLQMMEYQVTIADNSRDALKRMRYHTYDLVVVNEDFDCDDPSTNGIILYLERLGMSIRRNMFVALVSARHRTMDNMMAFHRSVNLIINVKNIEDIGKIISRGITDHGLFYRMHKEMMKETGRV